MKNLIICFLLFSLLGACNSTNRTENLTSDKTTENQKTLRKEIKALEARLSKAKKITSELEVAKILIKKSQEYGEKFPEKKDAPDIIFKAADVARGIGQYGKAIQLWGRIWRQYPDYIRAGDALFMQGFTYENNLGDLTQAKNYYIQFLQKHPKHELREQVTLSLKNLGKSPEDLIKEFQKKKESKRNKK